MRFLTFIAGSVLLRISVALSGATCEEAWDKQKLTESDFLYHPSIHSSYNKFYQKINRKNCLKEWSVFIYMNADNDLTDHALLDIKEMSKVGSSKAVDIVVQLDTCAKGVSRLHIAKSEDPSESAEVEKLKELDSGSPTTFSDFLSWAALKYPSKHYAVILWSHGLGIEGISFDESSHPKVSIANSCHCEPACGCGNLCQTLAEGSPSYISIPQLRSVLSSFSAKFLRGKPIDVYGSDACLMQMLEVAYEFKKHVKYIVGSANMEGKSGWPYEDILSALKEHPYDTPEYSDSAKSWVTQIPNLYQKKYHEKDERAVMTVIYAHELKRFFPYSFSDFGAALLGYIHEDQKHEALRLQKIKYLMDKAFNYSGLSTDLFHFTALISSELQGKPRSDLTKAEEELLSALGHLQYAIGRVAPFMAVSPFYYTKDTFGFTRGLAAWLPIDPEEYRKKQSFYFDSKLYRMDMYLSKLFKKNGFVSFIKEINSKPLGSPFIRLKK